MASFTKSAINVASGNAITERVCLDLVLLFSILRAKERELLLAASQYSGYCDTGLERITLMLI